MNQDIYHKVELNTEYVRENIDTYDSLKLLAERVNRFANGLSFDDPIRKEIYDISNQLSIEASRMLQRNGAFRLTPR